MTKTVASIYRVCSRDGRVGRSCRAADSRTARLAAGSARSSSPGCSVGRRSPSAGAVRPSSRPLPAPVQVTCSRRLSSCSKRRSSRRSSSINRRRPGRRDAPTDQPDYRTYYMRRPVQLAAAEWGLNLHLEGAIIGGGYSGNAGLGGFGAGLRYKPSPWFGVEAGRRLRHRSRLQRLRAQRDCVHAERPLVLEPAQPRAGLLARRLRLEHRERDERHVPELGFEPVGLKATARSYHYFGGQAGVGLEYRMTRNIALNIDMRGFMRGRTDSNADAAARVHRSDDRSNDEHVGRPALHRRHDVLLLIRTAA